MANIFNTILTKKPKYSHFDLSYDHKMSLRMGKLVPFHLQECVPGDKFNIQTETLLRFMPLISPVMHRIDVFQHFFFVPNRLIWDKWETFITGGADGTEMPAIPYMGSAEYPKEIEVGSIHDYLGLPVTDELFHPTSIFPQMAYHRIWFDWYRDQNMYPFNSFSEYLPTDHEGDIGGVAEFTNIDNMHARAWEHDYFTSALPWAQKGEAVNIPLSIGGADGLEVSYRNNELPGKFVRSDSGGDPLPGNILVDNFGQARTTEQTVAYDPNGTLIVDKDEIALDGTINDLRTATALQRWLERNARGGSRYIENILNHFGVRSSDKRLQRAEFIGGTKAPAVISEVLQTSETADTPQATMAGHGVSVSGGKRISYYCEEHGYIVGIISVMPKTSYYQGIPRHFSKFDKMDYYWPDFAHLGEQEIKNKELFYEGSDIDKMDETFGYIPRYAEYKYNINRISGQMRTSLDYWHMARKFSSSPALNSSFINADPTDRIFAVETESEDHLVAHIFNKITARRPMPKYGTPML